MISAKGRDECIQALQIARGNPDLAFEVLQHSPAEIAQM